MDMFKAGITNLKNRTSKLTSQLSKEFQKDGEQPRSEAEVDCVPLTPDGPVLIQYIVQNSADGEREGSVFMLPSEASSSNVSVGLIKAYFPLPGCFHFRFKAVSLDGMFGGYVWVDLEDSESAPVFSGGISLKVLRLPDNGATPARRPRGPVSAPAFLDGPTMAPARAATTPEVVRGVPMDVSFDEPRAQSSVMEAPLTFDDPPSPSSPPRASRPPAAAPANPTPPAPEPSASLWDSPAPLQEPPARTQTAPSLPIDLMEMDSAPMQKASSGPVLQGKQFDRDELVKKREAETRNRVEQAAQDVIQRRASEASLNESKREAGNKLRHILDAWAKKPDGCWKDIRTLLSTQHEVLWQGSGWQPVGLQDLLQDGAIKRIYRKAIIIVHPDKMKEADSEKQIRAERIFQALNEAFKAFQEGGS